MKTRILHTKFWTDPYMLTLPAKARLLYNFYLTNDRIGHTGVFEIPKMLVQMSTGLSIEEIDSFNKLFMDNKKVIFYEEWVFVVNTEKYQSYTGAKNDEARKREIVLIPLEVKGFFSKYTIDTLFEIQNTLINHKSEIKDQKPETIRESNLGKKYRELIEAKRVN